MTKVVDQELVGELARDLVGAIAPEELPLFAAMSKAWFADPARVQMNQGDDVLAFGVAEAAALLSPVLLAAATHALDYAGEELGRNVTTCLGRLAARATAPPFPPAGLRRVARWAADCPGARDHARDRAQIPHSESEG